MRLMIPKNLWNLMIESIALLYLEGQPGLKRDLRLARKFSPSTGCNAFELAQLHLRARRKSSKNILELGSGVSTLVLAHACWLNNRRGVGARVISMEESPLFAAATMKFIPAYLRPFLLVITSKVVTQRDGDWTGFSYEARPRGTPDFVFIDGPQLPDNGVNSLFYDSDVEQIAQDATRPFVALLDGRNSTKVKLAETGLFSIRPGKHFTKYFFKG
jgi:hypothetical protein